MMKVITCVLLLNISYLNKKKKKIREDKSEKSMTYLC